MVQIVYESQDVKMIYFIVSLFELACKSYKSKANKLGLLNFTNVLYIVETVWHGVMVLRRSRNFSYDYSYLHSLQTSAFRMMENN